MKPALPHVRHVQKPVTHVLNIAKENLKMKHVKSCAGLVLMPAANVQKNAEIAILIQHNNVQMPAVPVQKNAKSMTMNIVSVVQKNAGNAKQNAERLVLENVRRVSIK